MSAAVAVAATIRRNHKRVVDRLVRENLRLVTHIAAQHYSPLGHDELISAGNVGLVIAAQRYSAKDGKPFSTVAGYWIRAYMRRLIQEESGAHRTNAARKLFWKIRQTVHEVGEDPEAIAQRLNVKVKDVNIFGPHLLRGMVHLDASYKGADGPISERLLVDETNPETLTVAHLDHIRHMKKLRAALASLKPRDRYVIKQRFFEEPKRTLNEIGAVLGMTRENVRQIEVRVLRKLREALA